MDDEQLLELFGGPFAQLTVQIRESASALASLGQSARQAAQVLGNLPNIVAGLIPVPVVTVVAAAPVSLPTMPTPTPIPIPTTTNAPTGTPGPTALPIPIPTPPTPTTPTPSPTPAPSGPFGFGGGGGGNTQPPTPTFGPFGFGRGGGNPPPPPPPPGGGFPMGSSGGANLPLIGAMNRLTTAIIQNSLAVTYNTRVMAGLALAMGGGLPTPPSGGPPPGDKTTRVRAPDWIRDMERVFAGAAGGILLLNRAADSSAMSTFTGDLKILAGEVGEIFTPYVLGAAHAMEDWANAFASWNPATKAMIAQITIATVATLGFGVAASRAVIAVRGLWGAMVGLGGIFGISNPIIAGLAGIGIAVAGVTAAYYALSGAAKDANGALKDANANVGPDGRPRQRVEPVKIEELPKELHEQFRKPENLAPEKLGEIIGDFRKKQEEQLQKAQQANIPFLAEQATRQRLVNEGLEAMSARLAELNVGRLHMTTEELDRRAWAMATQTRGELIERGKKAGVEFTPEEAQSLITWEVGFAKDLIAASRPPQPLITPERVMAGEGSLENRTALAEMIRKAYPDRGAEAVRQTQEAERLKGLIGTIDKLAERIGIAGVAGGPGGRLEDFKPPVRARYTDAIALRESVQLQALNVTETEAEATRRELERWATRHEAATNNMIQAIRDQTEALKRALAQIKPVVD